MSSSWTHLWGLFSIETIAKDILLQGSADQSVFFRFCCDDEDLFGIPGTLLLPMAVLTKHLLWTLTLIGKHTWCTTNIPRCDGDLFENSTWANKRSSLHCFLEVQLHAPAVNSNQTCQKKILLCQKEQNARCLQSKVRSQMQNFVADLGKQFWKWSLFCVVCVDIWLRLFTRQRNTSVVECQLCSKSCLWRKKIIRINELSFNIDSYLCAYHLTHVRTKYFVRQICY